eukprot:CAMPEP_0198599096 /NCGR_PEP_ID=MMETSP1462-20131121/146514_1 /TAXON_ID=1333877 /ORGANISM="Brandtodinium nutriculum, Strain RCC3387" /LENGTH=51 /DNA_ID=CAMNT_0044330777 /DNA_START=30 /DNA_END=185 /DNA_ORIENTATION=+
MPLRRRAGVPGSWFASDLSSEGTGGVIGSFFTADLSSAVVAKAVSVAKAAL